MTGFSAKVVAARAAAGLSRRTHAGGGTTLPGKLLLRMAPDAIERMARRLAQGSVAISATNGKTTTAKMLAEMLGPGARALPQHRRARTWPRGSPRRCSNAPGRRPRACSRSTRRRCPRVARSLRPRATVLGNLFRDQLDRYGELEAIAARWQDDDRRACRPAAHLVRNGDDPLLASLGHDGAHASTFGIDDPGSALREMQHASDSKWCPACGTRLRYDARLPGPSGRLELPRLRRRRGRSSTCGPTRSSATGLDGTRFVLRTPLGDARRSSCRCRASTTSTTRSPPRRPRVPSAASTSPAIAARPRAVRRRLRPLRAAAAWAIATPCSCWPRTRRARTS